MYQMNMMWKVSGCQIKKATGGKVVISIVMAKIANKTVVEEIERQTKQKYFFTKIWVSKKVWTNGVGFINMTQKQIFLFPFEFELLLLDQVDPQSIEMILTT